MTDTTRPIQAPDTSPETEAFWQGAKDGKLLVRTCNACGDAHHYPRTICPFCGSADTAYVEAAGKGTIYSYSVTRRAPIPYAIAYVTLDEGPTMMTNIVDCDLDAIKIGQRVEVTFAACEDGDGKVPMFKPA
jgi:uncharacterized OB-fold protein